MSYLSSWLLPSSDCVNTEHIERWTYKSKWKNLKYSIYKRPNSKNEKRKTQCEGQKEGDFYAKIEIVNNNKIYIPARLTPMPIHTEYVSDIVMIQYKTYINVYRTTYEELVFSEFLCSMVISIVVASFKSDIIVWPKRA